MPLAVSVRVEHWPIRGGFTISRGTKREACVVVVEVSDGDHTGRGECVPYPRYGETAEGVVVAIEAISGRLARGLDRHALQSAMPAGAARNALDCAFWDLDAKRLGRPASDLASLPPLRALLTAYTLSLGSPQAMAESARLAAWRPLLKLKLGGEGDVERLRAVRSAVPEAELIVDANEAWDEKNLARHLDACAEAGVTLVEQPLPASRDALLARLPHPMPICADESVHDRASLAGLAGKYDAVNVKLDKAGGLTEALGLASEAERLGLGLMVGCMVGTSLAIAPAILVAQRARVVDLDGPLLLAHDRANGLHYEGSLVHPPSRSLWG